MVDVNVSLAPLPEPSSPLLPGSVDEYLVTNVPMCGPEATASQVRAMLAGRRFESAADVAVCADGDGFPHRLLGLIALESLIRLFAVRGGLAARRGHARALQDDAVDRHHVSSITHIYFFFLASF